MSSAETSAVVDLAARKVIEAEKAKGNALPYIDAVRRIEMARQADSSADRIELASAELGGVEEQSARLDFAARKEMQVAKAKGEEIPYIEAVRRVELARATKG